MNIFGEYNIGKQKTKTKQNKKNKNKRKLTLWQKLHKN